MKKWMFRVACLLALVSPLELAMPPSPAQAVTATTKYTLTTSSWTDLGVGPVLVSAAGRVAFAVADTTPSLVSEGFSVLPGASFTFNTSSHVWAMSLDGISPYIYVSPILASSGGGGGSLVGGTTPITGTCPSGQFLYNNSGVLGCSASSATIAMPQAVTGGVSGGIPYFSNTTTMSSSALLAANAIMLGKGAGVAPATTTTGTGVVTALGVNTNAAGGVALVNTVPTNGNFVKWSATGLVDGGAGSGGGTITANSTPTTGFTAGQAMYSDGSLTQAAGSYYSANLSSQRNGVTAQAERVYNTYTDASNGEWGTFDWTTSANILTIGTQNNGTGAARNVQFVRGGVAKIDIENTLANYVTINDGLYIAGSNPINSGGALMDLKATAGVLIDAGNPSTLWIGGGTSSFPELINSGATLQVKLGDGSNFTSLTASAYGGAGTKPTVTGSGGTCATGTTVGGATVGTFQTSAICAAGNTIALTGMPAQTTGYVCDAMDRTLPAALIQQTATTTTGVTFTVAGTSTAASNVVQWKCIGY
jgi:fibronectin-binding autotransporter adhesin